MKLFAIILIGSVAGAQTFSAPSSSAGSLGAPSSSTLSGSPAGTLSGTSTFPATTTGLPSSSATTPTSSAAAPSTNPAPIPATNPSNSTTYQQPAPAFQNPYNYNGYNGTTQGTQSGTSQAPVQQGGAFIPPPNQVPPTTSP